MTMAALNAAKVMARTLGLVGQVDVYDNRDPEKPSRSLGFVGEPSPDDVLVTITITRLPPGGAA